MSVESDRAHTAFASFLEVPFPLVSDFNRVVVRQFGIDYLETEPIANGGWYGMSRRSVFVLDRTGTVRYVWLTDDPLVAPDVEEVISALQALAA